MIRVNLIREYQETKRSWIPSTGKVEQVGLGIFAVAALALGGWYWMLDGQRAGVKAQLSQLQQRNVELKVVRAQVEQFQQQRLQLEERIETIEQLSARTEGPVWVMNQLIDSMPSEPRLWLTNLEQNDDQLELVGRAFDVLALADFIAQLGSQDGVTEVELEHWQEENEIVNFTLHCRLIPRGEVRS